MIMMISDINSARESEKQSPDLMVDHLMHHDEACHGGVHSSGDSLGTYKGVRKLVYSCETAGCSISRPPPQSAPATGSTPTQRASE